MFPTAKGINPKKILSTSSSHQKICSLCPNCKSPNCEEPKTRQCNLFEGEIVCDELPTEMCSFSIASSGKRCLLETYATNDGNMKFQCKTSEVVVKNMAEWIESDKCVSSCGVDRKSVGISSDFLMEPHFTAKLCSSVCYQNCPNIVDLYYQLASGEGVFLPDLCKVQKTMPRRAMSQLLSSGAASGSISVAAAGPISAAEGPSSSSFASAPAFM